MRTLKAIALAALILCLAMPMALAGAESARPCLGSPMPDFTVTTIDGEVFTVRDVCGTDAIDIFIDDGSGYCHCDINEYVTVTWQLIHCASVV